MLNWIELNWKKVTKNKKIRNQLFVHTTNRILKKSLQYLQNPKSRKNKNGWWWCVDVDLLMLIGDADLLMSMCWCLCVDIDLLMLMCWFIDVDVAVDVSASWRRSWITSSCLLGTRSVCWRRGRLATPTPAPATSSAATTTSSTRPGGWFGLEVHYVEWVSKQSNYFIRTISSGIEVEYGHTVHTVVECR